LSIDDKDDGPFACEKIEIEDGPKNYEFTCAGVLDKKNKVMTLTKVPTIAYDIVLTASTDSKEQSKDPIFISIKGAKG